jgi:hypothetical protein
MLMKNSCRRHRLELGEAGVPAVQDLDRGQVAFQEVWSVSCDHSVVKTTVVIDENDAAPGFRVPFGEIFHRFRDDWPPFHQAGSLEGENTRALHSCLLVPKRGDTWVSQPRHCANPSSATWPASGCQAATKSRGTPALDSWSDLGSLQRPGHPLLIVYAVVRVENRKLNLVQS